MNVQELMKRLHREREHWRLAGSGPELSWTLRGIDIARKVICQIAKEDRLRNLERRPRLVRWMAADLLHAINQAITYLGRCDRAKAIDILRRASQAAQTSRANIPDKNGPSNDPVNLVS